MCARKAWLGTFQRARRTYPITGLDDPPKRLLSFGTTIELPWPRQHLRTQWSMPLAPLNMFQPGSGELARAAALHQQALLNRHWLIKTQRLSILYRFLRLLGFVRRATVAAR